ncbi:unnamed protein product, partial [Polarella glacialis]
MSFSRLASSSDAATNASARRVLEITPLPSRTVDVAPESRRVAASGVSRGVCIALCSLAVAKVGCAGAVLQ